MDKVWDTVLLLLISQIISVNTKTFDLNQMLFFLKDSGQTLTKWNSVLKTAT